MTVERWVAIPDYEGLYEISSAGRVRSIARPRTSGRVLRPQKCDTGYLQVGLSKQGVVRMFKVHRLVLLAFVGTPPAGHEGAHYDGDRHNNRHSNLRWATRSENRMDQRRHGTDNAGQRHPMSHTNRLRRRLEAKHEST